MIENFALLGFISSLPLALVSLSLVFITVSLRMKEVYGGDEEVVKKRRRRRRNSEVDEVGEDDWVARYLASMADPEIIYGDF